MWWQAATGQVLSLLGQALLLRDWPYLAFFLGQLIRKLDSTEFGRVSCGNPKGLGQPRAVSPQVRLTKACWETDGTGFCLAQFRKVSSSLPTARAVFLDPEKLKTQGSP